MTAVGSMVKRSVDLAVASISLALLSPLFGLVAVLIKIDSPGPVIFRQERVGRHFRPFRIYKFRTLAAAPLPETHLTLPGDPRVTRIGTILRLTKIDELPQLLNVLSGDMSLVGPRPELSVYVDMYHDAYVEILRVRPGVTDMASVRYRDEAAMLQAAANPAETYRQHILPDKVALGREYVRRASLAGDALIFLKTIAALCVSASGRSGRSPAPR